MSSVVKGIFGIVVTLGVVWLVLWTSDMYPLVLVFLVKSIPAILAIRKGIQKRTPKRFDVQSNVETGGETYRNVLMVVPLTIALSIIRIEPENYVGADYIVVAWIFLLVWSLGPLSDQWLKRNFSDRKKVLFYGLQYVWIGFAGVTSIVVLLWGIYKMHPYIQPYPWYVHLLVVTVYTIVFGYTVLALLVLPLHWLEKQKDKFVTKKEDDR